MRGLLPTTVEARRQHRREYMRQYRHENRTPPGGRSTNFTGHSVIRSDARTEDYEARRREMPEDTRTLTARLMGDPIPNDPRSRRGGHG